MKINRDSDLVDSIEKKAKIDYINSLINDIEVCMDCLNDSYIMRRNLKLFENEKAEIDYKKRIDDTLDYLYVEKVELLSILRMIERGEI